MTPPSLSHTHLNCQQWGGHLAQLGAPHRGVVVVEGGGQGPPAPPGVAGVGVALGHPGAEGLGGGQCLQAVGVRGVGGGRAQPPAAVGGVEGEEVGGRRVLVGEMGLELELEHLQQKEDVGEMVARQGPVPPPHSLCHRVTLRPWAHPRAPSSVSLPRDTLPPRLCAGCPHWEGDIMGCCHAPAPMVPAPVVVLVAVASPVTTGAAGVSMTTGTISMATSPSGPRRICTNPFSSSSTSRRSSASQ